MKTMMQAIFAMILTIATSGIAMAETAFDAQGCAIVPSINSGYNSSISREWTFINLSNISNKNVQCLITIYDQNGDTVTSGMTVYAGPTVVSSGTGQFDIPAHATRRIIFNAANIGVHAFYGHAVIEWKSDDSRHRKALIGAIEKLRMHGNGLLKGEFLINSGQPF
ncbi:hypothetical protein [Desulfovibrio sp. JC010]|uniref:hypothetical protein n=1 Tax=Desulfovibrio sp. JC010 TaxID=2593641 RepID=UPI0013D35E89|nr:hypothetical protein [Desulfovibrio sp. JC010]NDV25950.1 hypothetical protein [Desulfovibrio sp. JC010]